MRFNDLPIAARIWSAVGVSMVAFGSAAVAGLWPALHGAATGVSAGGLAAGLAAAAVASALAGWFVVRSVVDPFHRAVDVAVAIAKGQLDNVITADSRDELGWLLHELKQMQKSLGKSVARIRDAADMINTASNEIASGSTDLSQRTEEQAASLQSASSSMEELTATVRHNAQQAAEANEYANAAAQVAIRGGEVVATVVKTMGEINASASRIADIIGVIDGIAFQTNILALNAAVEAARAGDQGRGFAVVASEVRSLAQRSATSAREIKALIGDSLERVSAGARHVDEAGRTMGEIVDGVNRVSRIMSELAQAGSAQSGGIERITHTVAQMDRSTQQNSAMVEQTAAAAASMRDQAAALREIVGQFRLAAPAAR